MKKVRTILAIEFMGRRRSARGFRFALGLFLSLVFTAIAQAAWTPVGIGGGGAQYAPIISPYNSNLRFIGCDMSGWYRSADGGNSWSMLDFYQITTAVDYGFNNGVMCPMAFSPNGTTVYGFGIQQDPQNNPAQLLVSKDSGLTWSPLLAGPPWPAWGATGGRVTNITVSRGDPNFILVGTDSGIWISTNGGTSFSFGTGSAGYVDGIMVDQATQTLGGRTCYMGSNAGYHGLASAGVYKSTNDGQTWTAVNSGLPAPASTLGFAGASTGQPGGTRLFVVDANSNGLWTSTNAAAWTSASAADTFAMVACADNDTSTAYASNTSNRVIWQTTNGGGAWSKVFTDSNPMANLADGWIDYDLSFSGWGSPVTGLGVNGANSSQVMFSDLGENFASGDGGVQWQQDYTHFAGSQPPNQGQNWSSIGLEVTSVFQYAVDANTPNYNYICASDIGFCFSSDFGATWHDTARRVAASVPNAWTETFYKVAPNPTAGTILAAVSSLHDLDHSNPVGKAGTGGVLLSTNYGATWTNSSTGLPIAPTTSVLYDAANKVYYAASWGNGVYKSTNSAGSAWAATAAVAIGANHDVYSLELVGGELFCLLGPQKGYANAGGLFVSANGGTSWTNVATNLAGAGAPFVAMDFDVNPQNNSEIYLACQDGGSGAQGGCYHSINGGATWTLMTMPVGHTPYGFAPSINPSNPATVYYGTENQGFFETQNSGASWARVIGLPFASIQHMTFGTNATYVTTFGGGVWMQTLSSTASPSPSPSASLTETATIVGASKTATPSPTVTETVSATPSSTGTASRSPSASASPTDTGSVTATVSETPSIVGSRSPSSSATATSTGTGLTSTPSFTVTASVTETVSATPSIGGSKSPSSSVTATSTGTSLASTPSFTVTASVTGTVSATPSIASSKSPSSSVTATSTGTGLTSTPSLTATRATASADPTATVSPTASPSLNPTPKQGSPAAGTGRVLSVLSVPNPVLKGETSLFALKVQGGPAYGVSLSVFTVAEVCVYRTDFGGLQPGWQLIPFQENLPNGLYYVLVKSSGTLCRTKLMVLR